MLFIAIVLMTKNLSSLVALQGYWAVNSLHRFLAFFPSKQDAKLAAERKCKSQETVKCASCFDHMITRGIFALKEYLIP